MPPELPIQQNTLDRKIYWPRVVIALILSVTLACVSAISGYWYGIQQKEDSIHINSTSPKTISIEKLISPTPTLFNSAQSYFQEVLQKNCNKLSETISPDKLPIIVNTPLKASEIKCYLDQKTQAGFLYIGEGIWKVEIFDQHSTDPEWLGHSSFTYQDIQIPTSNPAIQFQIFLDASDNASDNTVGNQPVVAKVVRKIDMQNGEVIYVRTINELIPADDQRLITLLKVHSSYNEGYKGYEIDDYEAAKNDIRKTFFKDTDTLAEPEQTNLQKTIKIVSAISPR